MQGGGLGELVLLAGPVRVVGQQVRAQQHQRAHSVVVGVDVVAGRDERAHTRPHQPPLRVPLLLQPPCVRDEFGQRLGQGGGRAGGGCGGRGGGGDVVQAAGAQGQLQRLQQRSTLQAGPAALGVRGGAVAGVEAGGEVVGAAARLGAQAGHRPGAARPPGGRQLTVAELLDALQEHLHPGEEVELVQRRVDLVEQGAVLREQLQTARLVAGQRAELQVPPDLPGHGGVAAAGAVAGQVQLPGPLGIIGAQQRQQRVRHGPGRLLLAGLLARQDRLPHAQRPRVVARGQVVAGALADLAGLAVAEPGTGAARPQLVGEGGVLTDVGGQLVGLAVVGLQGEPGLLVAVAHLRRPLAQAGQRDLGQLAQRVGDPLEPPEQQVAQALVEDVGLLVEQGEQPGEDHGRLARLRAVGVRLLQLQQRPHQRDRIGELLGGVGEFLGGDGTGTAVGAPAVLLQRPVQLVGGLGCGGHRQLSLRRAWARRSRKERLIRLDSAGLSGRRDSIAACP